MEDRQQSISLKPLSRGGKVLRGLSCATIESALAVTEGLVFYHYNNNKKVSAEYLSLSNFVIAAITIYISIIVGNLSDRARGKFRRKPFVLFFAPLYAVGAFFRYGAFVGKEYAPAYYLVSYACQTIGRAGLSISNDAWNMELANEEVDRSDLYATISALGVAGITLGLALTTLPLLLNAFVLPILLVGVNITNVVMIPEGTPLAKRLDPP
jgi:Na+/melibiose symporter-like transporter